MLKEWTQRQSAKELGRTGSRRRNTWDEVARGDLCVLNVHSVKWKCAVNKTRLTRVNMGNRRQIVHDDDELRTNILTTNCTR